MKGREAGLGIGRLSLPGVLGQLSFQLAGAGRGEVSIVEDGGA